MSGPERVAAHQILPLDRRAGGAAADHAAALEHLVELPIGQRVRVGVDDVPLAAAVEPHGVGVAQDFANSSVSATFGSCVCSILTFLRPSRIHGAMIRFSS